MNRRAEWLNQTFLHWPYEPAAVLALLPPGLTVDEYDNAAWVSLMSRVRPPGLPATSLVSFPETNLRTYVRLPDGRDALWFLSADVSSASMLAGRTVGGPTTSVISVCTSGRTAPSRTRGRDAAAILCTG